MTNLELSNHIRENHKINNRSVSKRKPVHGFGINDADYIVCPVVDGIRHRCPAYVAWSSMISRCNDKKIHERQPNYARVSVCDEWKSFMRFRDWWVSHNVDGWDIDKDILTDSKTYSPQTCIFIPPWINTFTSDGAAKRGENPIGVCFHKRDGKFMARCCNPIVSKIDNLGYFDDKMDAHMAWMKRKLSIAFELKDSFDKVDCRIYPRIVEIIKRAK